MAYPGYSEHPERMTADKHAQQLADDPKLLMHPSEYLLVQQREHQQAREASRKSGGGGGGGGGGSSSSSSDAQPKFTTPFDFARKVADPDSLRPILDSADVTDPHSFATPNPLLHPIAHARDKAEHPGPVPNPALHPIKFAEHISGSQKSFFGGLDESGVARDIKAALTPDPLACSEQHVREKMDRRTDDAPNPAEHPIDYAKDKMGMGEQSGHGRTGGGIAESIMGRREPPNPMEHPVEYAKDKAGMGSTPAAAMTGAKAGYAAGQMREKLSPMAHPIEYAKSFFGGSGSGAGSDESAGHGSGGSSGSGSSLGQMASQMRGSAEDAAGQMQHAYGRDEVTPATQDIQGRYGFDTPAFQTVMPPHHGGDSGGGGGMMSKIGSTLHGAYESVANPISEGMQHMASSTSSMMHRGGSSVAKSAGADDPVMAPSGEARSASAAPSGAGGHDKSATHKWL